MHHDLPAGYHPHRPSHPQTVPGGAGLESPRPSPGRIRGSDDSGDHEFPCVRSESERLLSRVPSAHWSDVRLLPGKWRYHRSLSPSDDDLEPDGQASPPRGIPITFASAFRIHPGPRTTRKKPRDFAARRRSMKLLKHQRSAFETIGPVLGDKETELNSPKSPSRGQRIH